MALVTSHRRVLNAGHAFVTLNTQLVVTLLSLLCLFPVLLIVRWQIDVADSFFLLIVVSLSIFCWDQ